MPVNFTSTINLDRQIVVRLWDRRAWEMEKDTRKRKEDGFEEDSFPIRTIVVEPAVTVTARMINSEVPS